MARVTGRIVQLPAHDAAGDRAIPWPSVREAGLKVEDVEIRKADLEDVFMAADSAAMSAEQRRARLSV